MLLFLSLLVCIVQRSEGHALNKTIISTRFIKALEGTRLRISCSFDDMQSDALLFHYFRGAFNATEITVGTEIRWGHVELDVDRSVGRYDLILKQVDLKLHTGLFECSLMGNNKQIVRETYVDILAKPKGLKISPTTVIGKSSSNIEVTCNTTHNFDDCEISWFKIQDGNKFTITNAYPLATSNNCTSSISMVVEKSDNGTIFECQLTNKNLNETFKDIASASLIVQYPPTVKIGPAKIYAVKMHQNVKITCEAEANPPVEEIEIRFQGKVVSRQNHYEFFADTKELGGYYVCSGKNVLGKSNEDVLMLIINYKPEVILPYSSKEVKEGENLKVFCQVSANPPPETTQWVFEHGPTLITDGPLLSLYNITWKQTGNFTCISKNSLRYLNGNGSVEKVKRGFGQQSFNLVVRHSPGVSTIIPQDPHGVEGETVSLECRADPPGYPGTVYRWQKEGDDRILGSREKLELKITKYLEGTIQCLPENPVGTGTASNVNLTVYQAPRISKSFTVQELIAEQGDANFSLECQASSKPQSNVTWYRDQRPLHDRNVGGYFSIETYDFYDKSGIHHVTTKLRFARIILDYRGLYSCKFENTINSSTADGFLNIPAPPSIVNWNESQQTAFEGEPVTLLCHVLSFPRAIFHWTFKSKSITEYAISNEGLSYSSTIVIRNIQEDQFGTYTCIAKNDMGTVRFRIKLKNGGVPESPKNVTIAYQGSHFVIANWNIDPNFNHVKHKIVYQSLKELHDGQNTTCIQYCGTKVPCIIENLVHDTTYTLEVIPYNNCGDGKSTVTGAKTASKIDSNDFLGQFYKQTGQLVLNVTNMPFPIFMQAHMFREDGSLDITNHMIKPNKLSFTVLEPESVKIIRLLVCNRRQFDCIPAEIKTIEKSLNNEGGNGNSFIIGLSLAIVLVVAIFAFCGALCLVMAFWLLPFMPKATAILQVMMPDLEQISCGTFLTRKPARDNPNFAEIVEVKIKNRQTGPRRSLQQSRARIVKYLCRMPTVTEEPAVLQNIGCEDEPVPSTSQQATINAEKRRDETMV